MSGGCPFGNLDTNFTGRETEANQISTVRAFSRNPITGLCVQTRVPGAWAHFLPVKQVLGDVGWHGKPAG